VMARIKKWLDEHVWPQIADHITWIVLGGLLLAVTGFTPEEWVRLAISRLPIPTVSIAALAVAAKAFLGSLGMLFIVVALVRGGRLWSLCWLWLIFGLGGGFVLALLTTPFLDLGASIHPEEPSTGIRDHHHGSTTFKSLAGMQWGLAVPAPIYLYSVTDNIYATDFFMPGMNVTDNEIKLDDVYILSGMTGRRFPVLINVDNDWITVDKINPIPPHSEFDLIATLGSGNKGIPMTEFLKEWDAFSFVARYGGTEFKEDFDQQAFDVRNDF
jgi:hypothetical protein